jgi:hypothetical protein
MIKPMDGRTRAEAAKKFFGTLGTTFILGGYVALPMLSTLMGLFGKMWESLKDEDWPKELQDIDFFFWFRTVLLPELLGGTKIAGKPLADILERGVINALTGSDISGRISLSNLWMRDTKEYATVRESAMAMAMDKAGPSANMILSWAEAYDAFTKGEYSKGIGKAIPAGFRNFKNTFELWQEGAKDNKGAQILSKDAFTTGELLGQAIGFRSDLLANTQYVNFKMIGLERKIVNERNAILDRLDLDFRNAHFDRYSDSIVKRVSTFNKHYPSYVIDADAIEGAIMKRAEQRGGSNRGIVLTEKNAALFGRALVPSREAAKKKEEQAKKSPD